MQFAYVTAAVAGRCIASLQSGVRLWNVLVTKQHGAGCTCKGFAVLWDDALYLIDLWHSHSIQNAFPRTSQALPETHQRCLHIHAEWGTCLSAPAGSHDVMHAVTAQARPASPADPTRTWRPGSHGSAA